jgi:hypothetical protein
VLSENFRQHGYFGRFFNQEFYNNQIVLKQKINSFSNLDHATGHWLKRLAGKDI